MNSKLIKLKNIILRRNLAISEIDIKDNINGSLEEIGRLEEYINSLKCPCCKEAKKLRISNYRRGKLDWEAQVVCGKCASRGIVNPTGLHFVLVYKDIAPIGEVNG